MLKPPKVSIVIPVYNGANYLLEAIESALDQTYPNIEVIVVNDGSTDDGATEQIAFSFGNKIRYLFKENGGVASALNAGIRLMSGEYFSWLSHDDVYYSCKVAEQIEFLGELGRQTVVYSDYDVIDSSSRIIRSVSIKHYAPHEIRRALILDYPIHGCSILVPIECFNRVGYFDERLKTTQDCDMWFRIANFYDVIHMPISLIKIREHPAQGIYNMNLLHFRECNDFLIDSMWKVSEDLQKTNYIDAGILFIADCISSFSIRGFHKAARLALLHYSKSILLDTSIIRRVNVIRPLTKYIFINISRLKHVLSLIKSMK